MALRWKTTSQFVKDAMKVHGDRFDYSEVEYVNTHKPVRIKCRQCGVVFMQEPASHLAGHGCPNCGKQQLKRRMSQEAFIEKCRAVHGNRYDYSRTEYRDMRSKVLIVFLFMVSSGNRRNLTYWVMGVRSANVKNKWKG